MLSEQPRVPAHQRHQVPRPHLPPPLRQGRRAQHGRTLGRPQRRARPPRPVGRSMFHGSCRCCRRTSKGWQPSSSRASTRPTPTTRTMTTVIQHLTRKWMVMKTQATTMTMSTTVTTRLPSSSTSRPLVTTAPSQEWLPTATTSTTTTMTATTVL